MKRLRLEQVPNAQKWKNGDNIYTLENIIVMIEDGYAVEIIDENGFTVTKEFMFNHCFPNEEYMRWYLSEVLTIEDYESIIEEGGTKNVIERAIRERRK